MSNDIVSCGHKQKIPNADAFGIFGAATQRLPYGQEIEPDSAKPCREENDKQHTTCHKRDAKQNFAEPSSNRIASPKTKKHSRRSASVGAATQIRTGDLILTKDVLYQLSHSSVNRKDYSRVFWFCQAFLSKKTNFFQKARGVSPVSKTARSKRAQNARRIA